MQYFTEIEKIFNSLLFENPVIIQNLILYPIKSKIFPFSQFYEHILDLDGANEDNYNVKIEDTGNVSEINIKNNGKNFLFVLDGEILVGGKQDRVVITSTIIEPNSEYNIPVACVEEGRWGGTSNKFTRSSISHSKLRGITSKSIRVSQEIEPTADQKAIWSETTRKLTSLNISSPTKTLTALSQEKMEEINKYLDYEPKTDEEVGLCAIANGKFLGLDVFATPPLYRKYAKKIVLGYSWDAIEYKAVKGEEFGDENLQKLLSFFKNLPFYEPLHEIKINKNVELRFPAEQYEGKIFLYDENFIHSCLMNPR